MMPLLFVALVTCALAQCRGLMEYESALPQQRHRSAFRRGLPSADHLINNAELGGTSESFTSLSQLTDAISGFQNNSVCNASRYYRIDGSCNNLLKQNWGAANTLFVRELPSEYFDGKTVPRIYGERKGFLELLPSSRKVSVECFGSLQYERKRDKARKYSQMLMQFGQFLSHDLASTGTMDAINCCTGLDKDGIHPDTFARLGCFPIPIPENDTHFNYCMSFNRSMFKVNEHGIAQQINLATSFVDASNIYGSTDSFIVSIRTRQNGTLRLDKFGSLPEDNSQKCLLHLPLTGCPVSGDNRVNVFPGLTAMHLLWHREHNRVAKNLIARHQEWDDEMVFQESRRIVIAEMQNVVYKEYLPVILGNRVMTHFQLNQPARYSPFMNPTIINSFTTAAFRFGHSQIINTFTAGNTTILLRDSFFRPHLIFKDGVETLTEVLHNLLSSYSAKTDTSFATGIRDELFFGVDSPGDSTDLPARNIQRGRDHGLPPYYKFLDQALSHFGDPDYIKKLVLPNCLPGLYRSVKDVDLFLGGMCEKHVLGGVVGPTFAYLIGKQFKKLREGDRLFFDTQGSEAGFTSEQVNSIKTTSLSSIICRNSNVSRLQREAFLVPHPRNPEVECDELPDVNFSLW